MTEYETNMINVIYSGYRIKAGVDIFSKSTNETIKQNIEDMFVFPGEGENGQVSLVCIVGVIKFKIPLEDIGFRINEREFTLRQVKTIIMCAKATEEGL
jgi:hypothetical protein